MSLLPRDRKLIGIFLILPVLVLSSLVAAPFANGQTTTTTIPSTPSLNTITLTDYNGNDQSGISDLTAGKIQAYDYAVTPSEASTIPAGYNDYKTPAAWYGLEINPTNTTDGFNPFQFQQVRFALNYLVGRSYFVGTLLGGNGIPTYSVFGGEPDQLVTAAATAPYANITDSVTIANATIYKVLTAEGATFKSTSTPNWSYDGKPIIVSIFDRTDDPVKHAYDGYLESQLQAVGFQVNLIPGHLCHGGGLRLWYSPSKCDVGHLPRRAMGSHMDTMTRPSQSSTLPSQESCPRAATRGQRSALSTTLHPSSRALSPC